MASDEVKLYCSGAYIEHLREIERSMRLNMEEVQMYKERLDIAGISYETPRVSGTPQGADMAENIIEVVTRVRDMVADMAYQSAEVAQARTIFSRLHGKKSYALRAYCFMGRTWADIQRELGYKTYGGVMKLRRASLIDLYEIMPEEWRNVIPKAV